jgi:hypothetical protein
MARLNTFIERNQARLVAGQFEALERALRRAYEDRER